MASYLMLKSSWEENNKILVQQKSHSSPSAVQIGIMFSYMTVSNLMVDLLFDKIQELVYKKIL